MNKLLNPARKHNLRKQIKIAGSLFDREGRPAVWESGICWLSGFARMTARAADSKAENRPRDCRTRSGQRQEKIDKTENCYLFHKLLREELFTPAKLLAE
ncbi:MAG: hypothetical protein WHT09_06950 [Thermogutta sp.]|jgi:hypothetical protein